ncbi:COG4223 family protein [Bradyrhizobium sp. URHC0002]
MVDDRPEDTGSLPDSSRPKREPPTIDLEATDVSSETKSSAETSPEPVAEAAPEVAKASVEESPVEAAPSRPVSPWIVAPVSGAAAAALVIGVGWMLGWPAIQPASAPPAPQLSAAIDGLTARVAGLEPKVGKPVPDPASAARTEALEKTVAALRTELAATRVQGEKLASAVNEVKSAPRSEGTASPDLSGIDERIAKIESLMRAQGAEIAQQGSKLADTKADAKPADDMPLRRLVAAALLDVLVRIGEPYPVALAAAKPLAPNPEALKPLDQFAEKGVPNAGRLSTELLALVPKLSPAVQQSTATTGTGIVERLQAGAAKLVKIERTDTAGTDRGAVVARITAAALRNDANEARRELKTLEPADRAAAQSWLERADARDAALAASRQFAADAMAALGKPAQ